LKQQEGKEDVVSVHVWHRLAAGCDVRASPSQTTMHVCAGSWLPVQTIAAATKWLPPGRSAVRTDARIITWLHISCQIRCWN